MRRILLNRENPITIILECNHADEMISYHHDQQINVFPTCVKILGRITCFHPIRCMLLRPPTSCIENIWVPFSQSLLRDCGVKFNCFGDVFFVGEGEEDDVYDLFV